MKIKDFFYTENDKLEKETITTDWWLERFRNWRADELLSTDYTQLTDSPNDKLLWANYRQALRDLPSLTDFANADLPTKPV